MSSQSSYAKQKLENPCLGGDGAANGKPVKGVPTGQEGAHCRAFFQLPSLLYPQENKNQCLAHSIYLVKT